MTEEDTRPVVLDVGEYSTKIGYAGDSKPSKEFVSIVGLTRFKSGCTRGKIKDKYIGDEIYSLSLFLVEYIRNQLPIYNKISIEALYLVLIERNF